MARVGEDAFCLWMPQETILFEHAALNRKTTVTLAKDARYLGVETLVLGRAAMQETPQNLVLNDVRHVMARDGTPLHAEQIALTPQTLLKRENRAGLAGHSVFASLVYIAPDAPDRLSQVRQIIGGNGAASAWENRLILRVEGSDSWNIRCTLIPVIKALGMCDVPRVWQT